MKYLISILAIAGFLLAGCNDESSLPISTDISSNSQPDSPNWVQLPPITRQGPGIESEYSASKLIKGKDGGVVKLKFKIKRQGHPLGNYKVEAKIKVKKHSFPDHEQRLFTITFDPDYAYMNITPSPNTLDKHLKVNWKIKGIDVSQINPDTFRFIYVGDNSDVLETSSQELIIDESKNKIEVKGAVIDPVPTYDTPGGSRYGFTR